MNYISNLLHYPNTVRKIPFCPLITRMTKSKRSISMAEDLPTKRARLVAPFSPIKIATAAAAAAVDGDTPFSQLIKLVSECVKTPQKGRSIVFWMRMGDLRSEFLS
jgi:deoxyribodipyrimidine photo-lyase